ncbi:ABC transporter permease [Corynebacterium epidermidicanis]|uniref:Oligopeptide transport system permease protein OppC n=1 Tax=Corynebacterium epidermidicanis TaxID=1050174 RepID=A0A0G3GX45_9CORY|nr:ABC transporter permease [Corynebacterium epidermidicanis]AKK03432.1 ABC-type dipeptide/oligopeptide/nickel transport system, permease component [Corynebacterium epidermidicanis]
MQKEYRNSGDDRVENLAEGISATGDYSASGAPLATTGLINAREDEIVQAQEFEEHNRLKTKRPMKKYQLYFKRFMRNKMAVIGAVIFIVLVFFAIFGGFLAKWDYTDPDFMALSEPPSSEHWFGTSSSGTDLFAMVVHGLGRSLVIAILVSAATTIIAAVVGSAAALLGGRPERVILGIIHFLLVIPSFLLIALMVSGSGGDWKMLTGVLILFGWVYYARVIWSMSISLREREYIRAARYMGVSSFTTIVRHMIPNIGSLLIINLTLGVVSTVMSETGLSFLGLGVKIPDVSLGTLLSSGANSLQSSPWEFYFPAGVLTLLTVSMAFIADGLRDALDPNSNAGGRA